MAELYRQYSKNVLQIAVMCSGGRCPQEPQEGGCDPSGANVTTGRTQRGSRGAWTSIRGRWDAISRRMRRDPPRLAIYVQSLSQPYRAFDLLCHQHPSLQSAIVIQIEPAY